MGGSCQIKGILLRAHQNVIKDTSY
jgi:hypothetical protein